MSERLLVCSDLDRTLLPNGPQPESQGARDRFRLLAARPEVTVAYVSGRDRQRVKMAIRHYSLPMPDFVISDVGTTLYRVGTRSEWERAHEWEAEIALDWQGHDSRDLRRMLADISDLRPQETNKQNRYKLSYYVPLTSDRGMLSDRIRAHLDRAALRAALVWSVDEPAGVGLLDILPEHATKLHAIQALMRETGFHTAQTVFCGDSGNDLEVLTSPVPSVLVANSQPAVQATALRLCEERGLVDRLYIARGAFEGLNGNYSGGVLEGIAHYHPATLDWMRPGAAQQVSIS